MSRPWTWRPSPGLAQPVGRFVLAMVLSTVASLTLAPAEADAAFAGANGPVVFASSGVGFTRWCPSRNEGDQLFALPEGGSEAFQLTCNSGRDQHPFVSPDGSEVVFSSIVGNGHSHLFTIPLPSSPLRRLQHPTPVSDSSHASDDYPSWSPTGNGTIVFQRTSPSDNSQLYIEDVSSPSSAAPVFPSPTGYNDSEPVFDSSDPQLIAFVRRLSGHSHIFSYDLASHVLTDLSAQGDRGVSGHDSKPDFAATGVGGRIVFQSDRACGHLQLYTMTTQGTDQTPVFATTRRATKVSRPCNENLGDPVFSPEGDALAFDKSAHRGVEGVSTVSVDTSGRAVGGVSGAPNAFAFAVQPNWGPAADPPAQTPETPLPLLFPIIGAGIAFAALAVYRRNARRSTP